MTPLPHSTPSVAFASRRSGTKRAKLGVILEAEISRVIERFAGHVMALARAA